MNFFLLIELETIASPNLLIVKCVYFQRAGTVSSEFVCTGYNYQEIIYVQFDIFLQQQSLGPLTLHYAEIKDQTTILRMTLI